jgi:glycosyltransferase involved in cell wall biosynthesis
MLIPFVSVIMSVYNVEQYLERCLDSIVKQTYKNLEIICVNDGSVDNCALILEKYSSDDRRVKVITHTQNRGLSDARNTGMDAATGDYLYFIDSDDWVDLTYVESLVSSAEENGAEVVINSNVINEYNDVNSKKFNFLPFALSIGYDKIGFVSIEDNFDKIPPHRWTILYKKLFLDNLYIRFSARLSSEFTYFFLVTLVLCNTIYMINSPSYHYYHRNDSIRGRGIENNSTDYIKR